MSPAEKMLDTMEKGITAAIDAARQLGHMRPDFAAGIDAYMIPHLEARLGGRYESWTVTSMRAKLAREESR